MQKCGRFCHSYATTVHWQLVLVGNVQGQNEKYCGVYLTLNTLDTVVSSDTQSTLAHHTDVGSQGTVVRMCWPRQKICFSAASLHLDARKQDSDVS